MVMLKKTMTSLVFAAACLTAIAAAPVAQAQTATGDELVTNGPQSSGVEQSGNWSARQNVIQSERYQRLVHSNRAFRRARIAKECGPISDPQLHQQCLASFNPGESTMSGSSTAPSEYGNSSGR
jgi:hypothetical protein